MDFTNQPELVLSILFIYDIGQDFLKQKILLFRVMIVCVYVSITGYFLTGLFQKDRKNQNAKIVLMIKLEVAISLSRVIGFIHDDVALTGRKNWGKNYYYIPIQVILKLSFHDLQIKKTTLWETKFVHSFKVV